MPPAVTYRLGGLVALAIGLGLGWFFLLEPLQAAHNGASEINYSLKAFVAVPFCVVFGLAFLILGPNFRYRHEDRQAFTALGWIMMAVALALTAAGFFWFQQEFSALGYT